MENTCLLSILPVIPNWTVYNSVHKKTIKYCAILEEKREFDRLFENLVFSKNLKSSCSITDKRGDASRDKDGIELVFLNTEAKDLLALNLIVSKKLLLKRRNKLLLYFKNNGTILKYYHIHHNSIYVKCDARIKWHIFYNLFEFLFIRHGFCNTGAMFYCALFTGCILRQEIRFLCYDLMDACSDLDHNSQEDDKGSRNLNLSHACKKISNPALCNQYSFSDASNSQDFTLKIISDSAGLRKPTTKDTVLCHNMPKQKVPKLDCLCSEIHCKCHESEWQIHKNVSKYNVSSYMDILLKRGVASTDELSIAQSDFNYEMAFDDVSTEKFISLNNTKDSVQYLEMKAVKKNDLSLSGSQKREKYSPNIEKCSPISTRDTVSVLANTTLKGKLKPKPESLLKAISLLGEDVGEKENLSFLNNELSEKVCDKPKTFSGMSRSEYNVKESFTKREMFDKTTTSFDMFQTASGKKINISDTALKAAEKMFNEVMETDDHSTIANETNKNEFMSEKVSTSIAESANNPENGKDKHLSENIDEMLVDNFFDDICFDEKEGDLTDANLPSSMYTTRHEKLSSVGKVRKSLGGRRSLKPYSVPKS